MNGTARAAALVAAATMALAAALPAVASGAPAGREEAAAAPTGSSLAAAAPTIENFRYYEATVNVSESAEGWRGAVSVRSVIGGEESVFVFLSRDGEPVTCADETADLVTYTLFSADDATEPGPITLDIDRRLRTAHADAVVDLTLVESPGCGGEDLVTELPAQHITLDVTGTTERLRTSISGTTSSAGDMDRLRDYDLARDGTGTVAIDGLLAPVSSDQSFLTYSAEHFFRHGDFPGIVDNAAPDGGLGAFAATSRSYDPPDGLGLLFEDAFVGATVGPSPDREMRLAASAVQVRAVICESGALGFVSRDLRGSATTDVAIDPRLTSATAAATLTMEVLVLDDCTGGSAVETVELPVAIDLTASGPAVRFRGSFAQVTPGSGVERTQGWFVTRDAAGTLVLGDLTGPADLAYISRASR
ncbi:hypothetical protein V5H98_10685 [Georgenia sp. M64]|uniref:hypothetical protein n=1 Tax=Georgenia sp. M64 TaxID=3120520 RepID=UPI0030E0903D